MICGIKSKTNTFQYNSSTSKRKLEKISMRTTHGVVSTLDKLYSQCFQQNKTTAQIKRTPGSPFEGEGKGKEKEGGGAPGRSLYLSQNY